MDSRFASLSKNPRFLKPKKKDSKVSIDKRFSAIFNESNKEEGSGVKTAKTDKYGRKLKQSTASDLKRFYKLDEDVQEDVQEDVDDQEEVVKGASGDKVEKVEKGDDDWQDDQDELDDEDKAEQARRLIRGEGLVESSDEEEEADDDVEVEMIADEDEDEVEEEVLGPISKRFACVNMDWDNLKARDLYKVFDAFRPKQGVLKSVSIYKSEFGKERLEKEAREGPPKEIFGATLSAREEQQSMFGEEEGKDFDDEKLRKYQLDRLKYYYAVTVCDSPATANAIFTAVDGTEFEKSANVFNLQFIPDEMEFTDEPVDHATSVEGTYTPGNFSTAALQHSKAQLTWDLDDPDRVRVTRKKFTKEQLQDMDFKAYLASDTEEDSDDEEELKERMKKYKSLVSAPDDDEEGGASDGEVMGNMEITFTPGLSESAAAKMKKLSKEKEVCAHFLERFLYGTFEYSFVFCWDIL
ncbi:hypothetical protein BCR33DRAFT_475218 [Rhizoclosmatium globosum]|uniref:ESF1 RRM domain-containing protein n=1 Tax=Rhizoclosmatium globosum TaxID=329046 RepID=A0A1Y2BPL7_9FUNG|nr:hypothetical protein BCR33DRAFT_475218 [Rhizoclosmatium globosum]|eukprot:ORY36694.1 hypothetical protein BCR33DRAFT_475218 [Rhizoclosmatium globosum]